MFTMMFPPLFVTLVVCFQVPLYQYTVYNYINFYMLSPFIPGLDTILVCTGCSPMNMSVTLWIIWSPDPIQDLDPGALWILSHGMNFWIHSSLSYLSWTLDYEELWNIMDPLIYLIHNSIIRLLLYPFIVPRFFLNKLFQCSPLVTLW